MSSVHVSNPDPIRPDGERPGEDASGDSSVDDEREALSWALDVQADPALASADWLVRDIDARYEGVSDLLGDPSVPLDHLRAAKSAFKTMRIMGETAADRRVGGSLYAAVIAAALVWHGERISRQSDGALARAFRALRDNEEVPSIARDLGHRAVEQLRRGADGGA